MISRENTQFRTIFLGSCTGFFRKYTGFGAFLEYLCDYYVFFRFGVRFDAFLEYLSNFADDFSAIFRFFIKISDDFGGSDLYFDTVLTRSPSIFAIFAMQI